MLRTSLLLNLIQTNLLTNTAATHLDPLEQFDVLATSLPLVGDIGLTNLALLLTFNLVVMGS